MFLLSSSEEEFEDTEGVIRICNRRRSLNIRSAKHNTQKIKIEQHEPHKKIG
jgi:hypothetical protein